MTHRGLNTTNTKPLASSACPVARAAKCSYRDVTGNPSTVLGGSYGVQPVFAGLARADINEGTTGTLAADHLDLASHEFCVCERERLEFVSPRDPRLAFPSLRLNVGGTSNGLARSIDVLHLEWPTEASDLEVAMSVGDGQSEMPTQHANLKVNLQTASDLVVASYAPLERRRPPWLSSPRRSLKRKRDRAIGEAPNNAMGILQSLIADSDLRAYDAQRASKRWGRAYYMLGLPAAVLATIAGAAGLASTAGRIPVAIVALAAAGLATAATFLNSNENKLHSGKLSAAWQELADDVRLAVIQYGQNADRQRTLIDDDFLIRQVIRFNKRKSTLLRGDLNPPPEEPERT